LGNTTMVSQLNVSGMTILEGAVTASSTVNINGTMTVLKKSQLYKNALIKKKRTIFK
jgi:hypothetical protein